MLKSEHNLKFNHKLLNFIRRSRRFKLSYALYDGRIQTQVITEHCGKIRE